jgi:hypothetical protein
MLSDSIHPMTDVTSTEPDIIEPAAIVGSTEHVYLAVVINPEIGNQLITAHRSREGAHTQIDELATSWQVGSESLNADILELPLLP